MLSQKCLPGFFYIKRKEREREWDSGETARERERERERECEAERCSKRKMASAIKLTVRERIKHVMEIVRLISEIKNDNDVTPMIRIRSSVHLWMTFRLTTSHRFLIVWRIFYQLAEIYLCKNSKCTAVIFYGRYIVTTIHCYFTVVTLVIVIKYKVKIVFCDKK